MVVFTIGFLGSYGNGMEMLQSHRVDKLWIHVYFQLVDQCRRRIAVAIAAANECIH